MADAYAATAATPDAAANSMVGSHDVQAFPMWEQQWQQPVFQEPSGRPRSMMEDYQYSAPSPAFPMWEQQWQQPVFQEPSGRPRSMMEDYQYSAPSPGLPLRAHAYTDGYLAGGSPFSTPEHQHAVQQPVARNPWGPPAPTSPASSTRWGPPAPTSPALSTRRGSPATSWATARSFTTASGGQAPPVLHLDPTNPWAEDVLRLRAGTDCSKIAGHDESAPGMHVGNPNTAGTWRQSAQVY
eukprot:TRINITY_DN11130_c0_g1_i1.p1 TRINITY_DN11130_c0_g1~~TRINITY_DN11130_c0_g1_i1.p1  ORF type:complete len:256 (-),score=40.21 TRINITY_DN11130_c0_g1_i1:26-745(-)